ncbi:hypothetical protein [Tenacibaculum sp. 190130A14a]|uniref:Restriction endonuclease n=1 Tax=Tenacibaculum polynesiense TaxID=3137857 RepID=A0ABM9PG85_9FLAO
MNKERALDIVLEFKGQSLKSQLAKLKLDMIGKVKSDLIPKPELFDAALIVKKASAQINEVVHAVGIINSISEILDEGEKIVNLSLASGDEGDGFDLETDKRVAEFKFSRWQKEGSKNGMRKRQIFADFAKLTILNTNKKKEIYALSSESIIKYFNGKASWEKVLSKSGNIKIELKEYLDKINKAELKTLKDISSISTVEIIDLEKVLKNVRW